MRPNQQFYNLLGFDGVDQDNHIFKLSDYYVPTLYGGATTSGTASNDYWEYRVDTDSLTYQFPTGTASAYSMIWGTASGKDAMDNCYINKWGVTGGSGIYSWEIGVPEVCYTSPTFSGATDPINPIIIYIIWDVKSINQTYININIGSDTYCNNSAISCNWFVNGIAQKQNNINNVRTLKIIWDKNTGLTSIYTSYYPLLSPSLVYNILGTYSIINDNPPFFVNAAYVAGIYSVSSSSLYGPIISNFQPNGLTGTNRDVIATPPPLSQTINTSIRF